MSRLQLSDLDFNSQARIRNLPTPQNPGDAANMAYVDAAVEGLAWKDSCRVATTANLNLSSPGATIDGVAMAAGDRVLVKNQTAGAENGIYIWNGAAVAMTRSNDCSTAAELEQAVTTVEEGTSAGATFRQSVVNATLGTTTLTWATFGTVAPAATETTAGIAEIATQAEVDAGTDDQRMVTPLKLATYAGGKKKLSTLIGDGSANQFTVTHNFNSRDVHVAVYRNSGAYDEVGCDVEHTTVNSVTIRFASAPTANQFQVVVVG